MERDPQEIIREWQIKFEESERGRLEERRGRLKEQRGRIAVEDIVKKTAFIPFLSHCYRLLFQPVSVQKVTGLRSSGGLTDINARYYPRELRPWTAFPSLHNDTFAELHALFADEELFPSQVVIEQIQRDLSPSPLADEEDLRPFELAAIELRAKDVISKYLLKQPQDVTRVIFRSNPYSLRKHQAMSTSPDRSPAQSPRRGRSRSRNQGSRASSPAGRPASKRPATSPPPGSPDRGSSKRSTSRRIVPDRWCIAQNAANVRRPLFTVEYKAAHKAMPEMLMKVLDGRPSDVTLFPDAAEAARLRKEKSERSKLADTVLAENVHSETAGAAAETTESTEKARSPSPSSNTARNRTAQILIQAFHYMVDSGLAYSYVSTGESLILLYVDHAHDPSVLYYHLSVPKQEIRLPALQEESEDPATALLQTVAMARQTPIALVLTLILLALQQTPLSFEAKRRAQERLKAFPDPYNNTADEAGLEQAVSGVPAGQEGDGSSSGGGDMVVTTALPPRQSYCTQQCLRGLRLGLALDGACPNVALHRGAGSANSHTLTPSGLLSAVVEQLAANLDSGCCALDGHGKFGAIGALFKVSLFPLGYTFVAKGVQDSDRECLDWEERAYQRLATLQGRVVPVCLGLVDLRRAYVLTGGARVSRLMLLSYAGETPQPDQVDEEDMWQLEDLLRQHGVEHGDMRLANVLWNAEQQRPMVVDFDRATIFAKRKRSSNGVPDEEDGSGKRKGANEQPATAVI
ncbi:phosphotransferase-like protein [Ophiostoma piceae UAMH 11346]|uniref:Phosphotransferase-like protein n=1 Tax=Ophiostoma piceae (strain UAMH 11346) TaxID=1262450 RepID=S3C1J4_OPHP1|nr:phosphotransferase-like protein [Ophiostoma piceae UAMH 11346]